MKVLIPNPWEKGQALLLVVLIMVVTLTVGLSLATRSITNLRTSTEEENSQRAFSAAEAGVEKYVNTSCTEAGGCNFSGTFSSDSKATYNAEVTGQAGTSILLNGGNVIFKDDGADLWLSNGSDPNNPFKAPFWGALNGKFTVYWGNARCTNNDQAAIEIVLLYGPAGNPNPLSDPKSHHFAYDPCSSRRNQNKFQSPASTTSTTINGVDFQYGSDPISIPLGNAGIIARIIPLYSGTTAGVVANSGGAFPSQGNLISSTGDYGGTKRKISYFQGYPSLPSELFPYILFSPL